MKNNVFLSELPNHPKIEIKKNSIYIKVENSIQHSGKAIYRINYEIQDAKLFISAKQRLVNLPFLRYENEIMIDSLSKNIKKIYWINPNGTKVYLLDFGQN